MNPFQQTPFTAEQLALLAMGKARGYSWEEMARQTELALDVVQRVPWQHEKLWNRYLAKAERLVARETLTEVADVLRQDVRHVEAKNRPTIVNSLTRVLKLQEEFAAPHRRPKSVSFHNSPVVNPPAAAPTPLSNTPTPATPIPTPTKENLTPAPAIAREPAPSVPMIVGTIVLFFALCAALLVAGWNSGAPPANRSELLVREPNALFVGVRHDATAKVPAVLGDERTSAPRWRECPGLSRT